MARSVQTPPLVFIVAIPPRFGKLYVRVHVYDRRDHMLRAVSAAHGAPHDHETAATIIEPIPVRGRIGDMFLTWRCARPGIISHESAHVGWAATKFIWGIGPEDDAVEENFAQIVERLTDRIWTRIHGSRLA